MRIISGNYKGAKLLIPVGKSTRPLKDLVKESIFNSLTHSNNLLFNFEKTNILDLFSGSGSFGLECLSRGAKKVTFVENNPNALKVLQKNIDKLKLQNKSLIIENDVSNFIANLQPINEKIDLLFLDPPFKDKNILKTENFSKFRNILNDKGIIIIHRHRKSIDEIPNYIKNKEEKIYGLSKIIYLY
tara:strand:- start:1034 stop:1594 length:561 start_codon:yes stop_codon:yes gene_type:complete